MIARLSMGYYDWVTFVIGAVIGLALGIPAGLLNWVTMRPRHAREIGWNWPIVHYMRRLA